MTRTVPPGDQPVRPAIALAGVSVLLGVVWALTGLLPWLFMQYLQRADPAEAFPFQIMVYSLIVLVGVLLMLGLGLVSFILAIIVTVKSNGKLRVGGGLIIAATLFGQAVTFTLSGDTSQLPDAWIVASNAFLVAEVIGNVLRVVALAAGVVILILGIREVRRARAAVAPRL